MIAAVFRRLDVDRVQWRALLIASLKADFAAIRRPNAAGQRQQMSLGFALLVYVLAGVSPALIAWYASDAHFAGTMLATFVAFMVVSSLLIGEGTTIISPSDHHVLGFRPVTSRTYLAVRIGAILVRTAVIASCVAMAPFIAFLFKGGIHPGRALAALGVAYTTGLAVTLAVVGMFGWMLRLAGPARMKRWALYTQFAAQSIAWLGFFVATQGIGRSVMAGYVLAEHPLWYAFPGAWFGAWVALAAGMLSVGTVGSAALSLALILALGLVIGGKLSLGYAESLARVAGSAAPVSAGKGSRWLGLLGAETRAVALLVRSHLRHDMKFRMGLISLIPITVMYMYLGGLPRDPFVERPPAAPGADGGDNSMIIMVMLFFLPATLRRVLVTSSTHRASWIYHATPADHATLVQSSRNLITAFFLLPYLVALAGILVYAFGHVGHALTHTFFVGMLSYLLLQAIIMLSPELPFSLPPDKEAQGGRMFGVMIGAVLIGMALYVLLTRVVYQSGPAMIAFVVVVTIAAWVMDRVTRRRAVRGALQYAE